MKKNVKKPKDEVINVRCTAEQKAELERVAAQKGVGVSTWLLLLGLTDSQERREKAAR